MKPGDTTQSAASIVSRAAVPPSLPISATLPPAIATSAWRPGAPVPSTTSPFLIRRSTGMIDPPCRRSALRARDVAPEPRGLVEGRLRERPLLGAGNRVLQLVERRGAHQHRRDGVAREGEAQRGLYQAAGVAGANQRLEGMRSLNVRRIVRTRGDRLDGRRAGRMPRLEAAERAAREDADADGAHALGVRAHRELLEILRKSVV